MILYELKHDLRDRCELDIKSIDDKTVNSLDEYLFRFPRQRKLAYAYLKSMSADSTIAISKLHALFKDFDDLEWLLHSTTHKKRKLNDEIYSNVVQKYIRNPYTWVSSMVHVQPYLFDAKYLLLGQFQSVADRCTWAYINTQSMHYAGIHNKVRTLEGLEKHNHWFVDKLAIEKKFYDKLLKRFNFSAALRIKAYSRWIEVYDDVSKLCLQFELHPLEIRLKIIFPVGSRQRGRKINNTLTMKLLSRYYELFTLYNTLTSSQSDVAAYLNALSANNELRSDTYSRLHASLVQVLSDFVDKSKGSYFDDEKLLNLYAVNSNSVERYAIAISRKYKRLRIYRKVKILNDKFNRTDDICLSSYSIWGTDIEYWAHELLAMGIINIGHVTEKHSLYDYELLATGKSQTFALQFLKLPQVQATRIFEQYESMQDLLQSEVNYLLDNNRDATDTRTWSKLPATKINTYFEWLHKCLDNDKFEEERKSRLSAKNASIINFTTINKSIL